jgi:hypothetical protein
MKRVCLILLFVLTPFAARAQETTLIPTVIKATGCDGSSAELVSSFKKAVGDSKGYRVVANLSDDGKNDKVMTVGLVCGERNNSVGVAFAYGMARCFGPKDCHAVTDGTSVGILTAIRKVKCNAASSFLRHSRCGFTIRGR